MKFKLLETGEGSFITVYLPGQAPLVASDESHRNFDEIVAAARLGDESVADLFSVGNAITRRFDDLVVGRVSVRGGVVHFDDDPMDNAITEKILAFYEANEDFGPLVKFMENVMANPQEESREQFFRWLQNHNFPIDNDGCIVAYKAVHKDTHRSFSSGEAFVNGVKQYGLIPNEVGDVVTMPRSGVDFDPNSACSTGLHAGTWEYASGFNANDNVVMHVKINPRDVVSVPHDSSSQKVRVCRYEVLSFAEKQHEGVKFDLPQSGPVDTRKNHLAQKRDPSGRFVKA